MKQKKKQKFQEIWIIIFAKLDFVNIKNNKGKIIIRGNVINIIKIDLKIVIKILYKSSNLIKKDKILSFTLLIIVSN